MDRKIIAKRDAAYAAYCKAFKHYDRTFDPGAKEALRVTKAAWRASEKLLANARRNGFHG